MSDLTQMSQKQVLEDIKVAYDKRTSDLVQMHCILGTEEMKRVIDKRLPEMRRMEKDLQPTVSHLYLLRTALFSEAREKNKKYLKEGFGEKTDPRLDSFVDYLVAINVDKILVETAITEQLAVVDTKDQHEYVQAYVEIHKTAVKTIKNSPRDVTNELNNWHRCYETFRTANGVFMMGVDYMMHRDYVEGLACLIKCYMMNKRLVVMGPENDETIQLNDKFKSMNRNGFYIDLCIEYCNEDLIARFEAGEEGIAKLVQTILVPAMHFLKGFNCGAEAKRLKAVKGRWKKMNSSFKSKWMEVIHSAHDDVLMFGDDDVANLSKHRVDCFQSETGLLSLNKFYEGYMDIVKQWNASVDKMFVVSGNVFKLNLNKKLTNHEKQKGGMKIEGERKDGEQNEEELAEETVVLKNNLSDLTENVRKIEELVDSLDKSIKTNKSEKPSKKDRKRAKKQIQKQQRSDVLQNNEMALTESEMDPHELFNKLLNKVCLKISPNDDTDDFKEMAGGVIEKAEKELEMKISEIKSLQSLKEKLKEEFVNKKIEFEAHTSKSEEIFREKAVEMTEILAKLLRCIDGKKMNNKEIDKIGSQIRALELKRSSLIVEQETWDTKFQEYEFEKQTIEAFIEKETALTETVGNRLKTSINSIEANLKNIDESILNIKLCKTAVTDETPKVNPNSKMLHFLENSIQSKEKLLECPVCFCVAKSPIYSCSESHLVCGNCRSQLRLCPECRLEYKDQKRHRYAEMMAKELDMLVKEREELLEEGDII